MCINITWYIRQNIYSFIKYCTQYLLLTNYKRLCPEFAWICNAHHGYKNAIYHGKFYWDIEDSLYVFSHIYN